jgi:hypothetical protein
MEACFAGLTSGSANQVTARIITGPFAKTATRFTVIAPHESASNTEGDRPGPVADARPCATQRALPLELVRSQSRISSPHRIRAGAALLVTKVLVPKFP